MMSFPGSGANDVLGEPLTYPRLIDIIRSKREDMIQRDRSGHAASDEAFQLIEAVREHADAMRQAGAGDFLADGAAMLRLKPAPRRNAESDGWMNGDDFGNGGNVSEDAGDAAMRGPDGVARQCLTAVERAQIASLGPRSAEAAVALIQSLARFNESDLEGILLQQHDLTAEMM